MSGDFSAVFELAPSVCQQLDSHPRWPARAAAHHPCMSCPKAFLAVYLVGNLRDPAPIAKPINGAIAFYAGGSHDRRWLHASVADTDGLSGGRVAMLPTNQPKETL